jgi:hypothetical protein
MTFSLFLDDERYPPNDGRNWIVARNVDEAKDIIRDIGWPEYISFDHDLGDGEQTGKDFANWMICEHIEGENVFSENFRYYVHSQNPIGAKNIRDLIDGYLSFICRW